MPHAPTGPALSVPVLPPTGGGLRPGAAYWTVHVLGVAIVATAALWISVGWWRLLGERLRAEPRKNPLPLWVALLLVGGAYALQLLVSRFWADLAAGWLADAQAGAAPVYGWVVYGWLPGLVALLPYAVIALVVGRASGGGRAPGPAQGRPAGWKAVEPVFRTLLPWGVVAVTVVAFPMTSSSLVFASSLRGLALMGAYGFSINVLLFPLVLGVLMPSLGQAIERALRFALGSGGPARGLAVAAGEAVLVSALLTTWQIWPGLSGQGAALSAIVPHAVRYAATNVVSALAYRAGGGVLWSAAVSPLMLAAWNLVPLLLAQFLYWAPWM